MRLQKRRSSNEDPARRSSVSPKYPNCPNCRRRMTVKQVAPLLFASVLDDVVFGCDECGTETKRTVKRS
jgi:transcription elongation factor Elf1